MAQPSEQDLLQAFDPTGYPSINGAQLLQLVTGSSPFGDKGFTVVTEDVAGNPEVPNANLIEKWKRYVWIRQSAANVSIYLWNENGATDATYLKWVTAFQIAIGPASITGSQIAPNTITDNNISGVDWSKIAGAPVALPPSGAAGGDLTGTYPNPSVAALAITSAKIALNAIKGGTNNQLATGQDGVDITKNIAVPAASTFASPSGASAGAPAANDRLVIGVGATFYQTVRKVIDALAEPVVGDALKIIRINSGGTGFEYIAPSGANGVGDLLQVASKVFTQGSTTTVLPYDNSIPQVGEGAEAVQLIFTPKSAASLLKIRFVAFGTTNTNEICAALFSNASADALTAVAAWIQTATRVQPLVIEYVMASPGTSAVTFSVRYGPGSAGTGYLLRDNSGATSPFNTSAKGYFTIEEVVGTLS